MQWLIDIIKEWIVAEGYALQSWVLAQGYLTAGFVNRGDPATPDFDAGDFPILFTWTELDLSAIVPANAKSVVFRAMGKHAATAQSLQIRKYGNANNNIISGLHTTVSNLIEEHDWTCAVDSNRKIEYLVSTDGWTLLTLTIKGWWY